MATLQRQNKIFLENGGKIEGGGGCGGEEGGLFCELIMQRYH